MIQADTPPAAPPPAVAEVVLARNDHTTVAANLDLPLTLTKAGRREEMIVRRVLFVNASVIQVRPTAGGDRYRWTLAGFLEREYCVRSLTGVLACTTPETEALPDKAQGEAALTVALEPTSSFGDRSGGRADQHPRRPLRGDLRRRPDRGGRPVPEGRGRDAA